jgi:hypothetical protein
MIIGEGNGPFKYKSDQPDPRLVVDFVNRPACGRRDHAVACRKLHLRKGPAVTDDLVQT